MIIYNLYNLGTQDAVANARSRINQLEKNYCTMVTTTQKVVRQRAPSIDEFRTAITLLPTSVKREQQHYLQDHLEYIYQAKSIDQIFGCLNLHVWNYLNFGLLERIVAEYGDPTTKEMMEEYKTSVQSFRKDTSLHVFLEAQPEGKCPEISPSLEKTLQEVRFHYRNLSRKSSLEEVNCIRLKLARELTLPDFVVELTRIEFGSVFIVWALPTSLAVVLKDKIENESFQFIQWADVVEVAIAGTRIYPSGMSDDVDLSKTLPPSFKFHPPPGMQSPTRNFPLSSVAHTTKQRATSIQRRQPVAPHQKPGLLQYKRNSLGKSDHALARNVSTAVLSAGPLLLVDIHVCACICMCIYNDVFRGLLTREQVKL